MQTKYNTIHGATRSIIERSFARLKGKMRRLHGLECTNIANALTIIEAEFVLHNFILFHESNDDDFVPESEIDASASPAHGNAIVAATCQLAPEKRDRIAAALH